MLPVFPAVFYSLFTIPSLYLSNPYVKIRNTLWIHPLEEGFALKLSNNKKNSGGKKNSPNIMGLISLVVWALIITALLNYFFSFASTANAVEVKFSDFITLVKEDKVEEVKLESNKYTFTLKKEAQRGWLTEYYAEDKDVDPAKAEMPTLYTAPLNYTDLALLFDQHKVAYYTPYQSDSAPS